MTSALHTPNRGQREGTRNPTFAQANVGRRDVGRIPLLPIVQDRMVRDFERGVRIRSLASIYQVRVAEMEGILRRRLRELEAAVRRAGSAAVATMLVLVGVSVADLYEAAAGEVPGVERGFRRSGRARKRGLEDGCELIELRQMVSAGGAM
jgi:hypothetical protein